MPSENHFAKFMITKLMLCLDKCIQYNMHLTNRKHEITTIHSVNFLFIHNMSHISAITYYIVQLLS